MKKLLPVVLSAGLAISFSQLAAAQHVGAEVRGPVNTDADVTVKAPHRTQDQDRRDRDDRSAQHESSSAGASADTDRQADRDRDDSAKHENQGKHKGWSRNKHEEQSSGSYRDSDSK